MADHEARVADILTRAHEINEAHTELMADAAPHERYERKEGRNKRRYVVMPTVNSALGVSAVRIRFDLEGEHEGSPESPLHSRAVSRHQPFVATSFEIGSNENGGVVVSFFSDLRPVRPEEDDPANQSGFEQWKLSLGSGATSMALHNMEVIELLDDVELSSWSGEQALARTVGQPEPAAA